MVTDYSVSQALAIIENPAPAVIPAISEESRQQVRELLPELSPYIESYFHNLTDDAGFLKNRLTATEKEILCRVYAKTGSIDRVCEKAGQLLHQPTFSPPTLYRHLEIDEDFRRAFRLAKLSTGDAIQTVSVKRALDDNGVVDRMCQLKRFFPSVYRENQQTVAVGVSINLSSCLSRPQQSPPA